MRGVVKGGEQKRRHEGFRVYARRHSGDAFIVSDSVEEDRGTALEKMMNAGGPMVLAKERVPKQMACEADTMHNGSTLAIPPPSNVSCAC